LNEGGSEAEGGGGSGGGEEGKLVLIGRKVGQEAFKESLMLALAAS
jgi:hypothetical protein